MNGSRIPNPSFAHRFNGDDDTNVRSHVRRPSIPWRDLNVTECGREIADGGHVITREEFLSKLKEQGASRSALTTCMTCWETASRHPTWEEDPAASLVREIQGARGWGSKRQVESRKLLKIELHALAKLAERHRDEFDELIADQQEVVPIAAGKAKVVPRRRSKW